MTFSVNCPLPRLAYAAAHSVDDQGHSGVITYRIDPTNGELTELLPRTRSDNITWLAVPPSGDFLYANDIYDGIVLFRIDKRTGSLSKIGVTPVGALNSSGAIDPSGQFL